MADFVIQDSLNKHDKDKDGQISKKEFLGEKIVFNLREAKGSFRLQEIFFLGNTYFALGRFPKISRARLVELFSCLFAFFLIRDTKETCGLSVHSTFTYTLKFSTFITRVLRGTSHGLSPVPVTFAS